MGMKVTSNVSEWEKNLSEMETTPRKKHITNEEMEFVARNYENYSNSSLAKAMGIDRKRADLIIMRCREKGMIK